jgi:alkyl hydroperoxide reductase subunit AhpC
MKGATTGPNGAVKNASPYNSIDWSYGRRPTKPTRRGNSTRVEDNRRTANALSFCRKRIHCNERKTRGSPIELPGEAQRYRAVGSSASKQYRGGERKMLRINDEAPNFTAETSQGTINFHEWIGDGWAILFSHPKDFTPVCTTELGYMAGLQPQFQKRNTKIIGLSVDPVSQHSKWAADIEETQGHKVTFPMIGDPELKIAKLYDMLPAEAGESCEGRTAANNATVRTVFVVGPDKKIKLMLSYPMSTGRNFDEVMRVVDSMQLTAKHKVATPVNWKNGDDVIILPSVSDEEAKQKYPAGWKAQKPYLRIVPQPK